MSNDTARSERDLQEIFGRAVEAHRQGNLDDARALYEEILRHADSPQVACNLATIMRAQGAVREAEQIYHAVTLAKPDFPEAHGGLGNVLRDLGDLEGAVAAFRRALEQNPDYGEAHVNIGNVLQGLGRYEAAADHFVKALELRPDDEETRFTLAAIRGEARQTAPLAYTKNLFDSYAERFDDHLTGELKYAVPTLLRDAIRSVRTDSGAHENLRVVDLGCGTGLCAAAIADMASTIHGVDIAPRMVSKAKALGIFEDVSCEDVVAYLSARPLAFDLALAGDVFIYVGDMAPCLSAAATALVPGGLFAFSVERRQEPGFALQPTARFAHSPSYVETTTAAAGFSIILRQDITIRLDRGKPLDGDLYVLRVQ